MSHGKGLRAFSEHKQKLQIDLVTGAEPIWRAFTAMWPGNRPREPFLGFACRPAEVRGNIPSLGPFYAETSRMLL